MVTGWLLLQMLGVAGWSQQHGVYRGCLAAASATQKEVEHKDHS